MIRRVGFLAALVTLIAGMAFADGDDPPSRVARLNYLSGAVSFRPGSVDDWGPATLNYPLTTGDHLWTDPGAQTEIHVGSTAVRMNSGTAISFLNLDDQVTQISLTEGALNVNVRYLGENESFEVDTPNVAISLLRPGDYRIQADADNNVSIVTVRGGEAEVTGNGTAFPVRAGQSVRLAGTDSVSQEMNPAPPPDMFDQWCMERERRESSGVSARYVPREMVGYEDLDEYGVWSEVPQYGWVWRPRTVAAGWAPYHYGHWAWVDPWGWTWIDDAPWGFAPFHYGRWAFVGGGWFWVPGRMVVGVRPVYAPALVAFVGGGGFSVGVRVGGGVGMAAWFPLGPGEVYRPAYHVSEVYVRNVNIVHVSNVTVINSVNVTNVRYVNQGVVGAVTVVPHDAFIHARPVASVAVVVPHEEIVRARVVGYTAEVAPVRESVLVRPAGAVVVHAPPARFAEREVVVRRAPAPPPVSFAAREQALRTNGGRPLEPAQEARFRESAPARAPMVRQVNGPGQTFGNRPGPQGGQTFGNRPGGNPTNEMPRNNMPPRNDRPPSARPSYQQNAPPQQQSQPAVNSRPEPVRNNEQPRTETPIRNNEPPRNNGGAGEQKGGDRNPPRKGNTKRTDRTAEKKDR